MHGRISFSQYVIAAGAIYHQVCSINFRTGKQLQVPLSHETNGSKRRKKGRPTNKSRQEAFMGFLIAPLQIGLAVQMHHHYGSKFLIDSFNRRGFCSSYTEVKKFEMSAVQTKGTDIPGLTPGHFVQYVADICTLDGQNTFHGMRIIPAVTPATHPDSPIPRCSTTAAEIAMLERFIFTITRRLMMSKCLWFMRNCHVFLTSIILGS